MDLPTLALSLQPLWPTGRLRRYRSIADRVIRRSEELTALTDDDLTVLARKIGWDARTGTSLHRLLPDAFALVRESSRRVLGMSHFPVQIMGGIALFDGRITEMQTGEGKTLTAALPTFLHALAGLGCHVITTNDYLAGRDAELLGPVYERLGLTAGRVHADSTPEQRKAAYACDVTYGTAQEIGFDFLRDRLQQPPGQLSMLDASDPLSGSASTVQRGHHFALIDEADSILIDEARTPLIIGLEEPNDPATVHLFRWSRRTIHRLQRDSDFTFEPEHRRAALTPGGCRNVLLLSKSSLLGSVDTEQIYRHIEDALTAELGFQRDRDYVVVNDEVQIVDESTGRIMEGRKWQQGLHQSIEAKERLPITPATGEAARVTIQSFFRLYRHVAGMTGTGRPARRELKHVYGRQVTVIPTHRPCIRRGLPPRIFATIEAKRIAVTAEIARRHATGQPLLVGTPSVAASQALGTMLTSLGITHQILNAYLHEQEADLISRAGRAGMITIATNMAGRGTDIRLTDEVRSLGGLHVMATEMHSSARIDRQLVGRAARQGDPGSFQFFLSLEDELFDCLAPELAARRRAQAKPNNIGELSSRTWLRYFRRTQRFLEMLHAKQRRELLKREKQRAVTYRQMGLDPCLELTEN
jgi:preprotein translocase subunit SecA